MPSNFLNKNMHRGNGEGGLRSMDARKPRLATLRQQRNEQAMRDELAGESAKRARAKVTLPKFSWDTNP